MASWFATVTNEKISQINEEAAPDNTKKVTIVDLAVFTGKASLFNLNLSNQWKSFFCWKLKYNINIKTVNLNQMVFYTKWFQIQKNSQFVVELCHRSFRWTAYGSQASRRWWRLRPWIIYGPIQWVTDTAVSKIWSATNNIIVNVLGGLSRHVKVMMKELVGMKNKCIKRFDAILLLSLSSNSWHYSCPNSEYGRWKVFLLAV